MLAPQLVDYLYSEMCKKIHTEGELLVTVETINTLESLIELAESKDRKLRSSFIHIFLIETFLFTFSGIQILTLLVPAIVSYLSVESSLKNANKYMKSLNDASLQWLMKIGPKYPQVRFINHKYLY